MGINTNRIFKSNKVLLFFGTDLFLNFSKIVRKYAFLGLFYLEEIMKNNVSLFVKTRTRLKASMPEMAKRIVSRNKRKRFFSKSEDIHEDRAIRQIKTSHRAQTYPHNK